jgi:hypothetical protein
MDMELVIALLTEEILPTKLAHSLCEFYASQPWHLIIHKQNIVVTLMFRDITALRDDNILDI